MNAECIHNHQQVFWFYHKMKCKTAFLEGIELNSTCQNSSESEWNKKKKSEKLVMLFKKAYNRVFQTPSVLLPSPSLLNDLCVYLF